ncbi:MAG: 2-oxoacid:acceptor oxidoreductase subunit alpha [Caldiserica bacterium]|jgi:2-oxoglutarate ferredoxin oxidoreductase subunit alpha|nr:2-oxoacid:acceptor oxidoreductase subunit alpha [Caldisericota bacterium]MDH7562444.1 2-oxoacid:acceptor oxidoreductase subunit alpha [Caldisericota bacterium]
MEKVDLVVRIGGESGEGIIVAGEILTLACARASFEVYTYRAYPAEVRGGHSMFQMRASNSPIFSAGDTVDILVALNQEAFDRHFSALKKGGVLVYDPESVQPHDREDLILYPCPLRDLAQNKVQAIQTKNILTLGVLAELFSLPQDKLEEVIREKFGSKGSQILEKDLLALQVGMEYARENIRKQEKLRFGEAHGEPRIVISGNAAIALGAIYAGCRFFAGYPITPATDILEILMKEMPRVGGVSIQVEDEISALAMAIGASFAGKKAMTATSGPGLSLMSELIGFSSMAEIPVVIVDVQRGGPATGLPTKTEQSDLFHAVFGSHGDCPRIVIAPTNVEDCFYLTIKGFNLAERTQLPVIILSDQSLSQRFETIPVPKFSSIKIEDRLIVTPEEVSKGYQRYRITENGLMPMGIPGKPGAYIARGLEHDGEGIPSYDPGVHQTMTEKRFRKLNLAFHDGDNTLHWGNRDSDIGIISWGSTEGAVREATNYLKGRGREPDVLYLKLLSPLPRKQIEEFLKNKRKVIVPEVNYSGQLSHLLRAYFLFDPIPLNLAGGRPFAGYEILQKIEEVL